MASVNRVILIGAVGSVEVKEKLVQVSLATNDSYKNKKTEEWVKTTEWHRLIFALPGMLDKAGEISKGDTLYIEGSIRTNSYETKEGQKRSMTEIAVTSFKTLASAKNAGPSKEFHKPKTTITESIIKDVANDDDIPF